MTKKTKIWPFARNTESVHENVLLLCAHVIPFPIPLLQYLWPQSSTDESVCYISSEHVPNTEISHHCGRGHFCSWKQALATSSTEVSITRTHITLSLTNVTHTLTHITLSLTNVTHSHTHTHITLMSLTHTHITLSLMSLSPCRA